MPAIGSQACNALNPRPTVINTIHLARTSEVRHHADRPLPAGHPPEHGNDSTPVRLPGRGGPYHRAGRLSDLGPAFPPGGNGLSRSRGSEPPRLMVKIRGMA